MHAKMTDNVLSGTWQVRPETQRQTAIRQTVPTKVSVKATYGEMAKTSLHSSYTHGCRALYLALARLSY